MTTANPKCSCSFCTHRREIDRLREALEEVAAWRHGNPTPRVIAEAALAEMVGA